jgi:glyoxylase-like metal-dependent hydrolase (beta-lactamase superfamily II)
MDQSSDNNPRVEMFTDLSFGTNSYVVWAEGSKSAVLIDSGLSTHLILDFLEKEGLSLEAILLTHAHPDHIAGVDEVAEATGADVYLHSIEIDLVRGIPPAMLAMLGIEELKVPAEFKPLEDGQVLNVAGLEINVLHTPGHSSGSVSFLIGNSLFDGDLVFRGSIGRTDFPGGDFETLMQSVRDKVFVLDPETKLYPGHMGSSTVGWEKRTNPFLMGL